MQFCIILKQKELLKIHKNQYLFVFIHRYLIIVLSLNPFDKLNNTQVGFKSLVGVQKLYIGGMSLALIFLILYLLLQHQYGLSKSGLFKCFQFVFYCISS